MSAGPDLGVKVPECDCKTKHDGPKLHRPGCLRMAAIYRKYLGEEYEKRYLEAGKT